jgi:hypothetical protein
VEANGSEEIVAPVARRHDDGEVWIAGAHMRTALPRSA